VSRSIAKPGFAVFPGSTGFGTSEVEFEHALTGVQRAAPGGIFDYLLQFRARGAGLRRVRSASSRLAFPVPSENEHARPPFAQRACVK